MDNEKDRARVYHSIPVIKGVGVLVLILVLVGGVAFGGSLLLQHFLMRSAPSNSSPNEVVRADVTFSEPTKFHEKKFSSIVPEDSTYFLEAGDFTTFFEAVPPPEPLSPLIQAAGSLYAQEPRAISNSFALVQNIEETGLVWVIEDRDAASAHVEALALPDGWGTYYVGDYLVITDSEGFAGRIQDAFKKRVLPMQLNSHFQSVVSSLPDEGYVFVYMPFRSKKKAVPTLETQAFHLVPLELTGDGFVLTEHPHGVLVKGVSND